MIGNTFQEAGNRPRVLVADDHSFFLDLFQILLEPTYELVGTVGDGEALLEAARDLEPDVVVLDIDMPRLDGIRAAETLRRLMPDLAIVFLTSHDDAAHVLRALDAGGNGYLIKSSAPGELHKAIQEVLAGGSYLTPQLHQLIEEDSSKKCLTPRQRSVVQLLAAGRSMKEAASALHITPRTIAFHKYNVMQKLGIESNAQLVQYALQRGLVPA